MSRVEATPVSMKNANICNLQNTQCPVSPWPYLNASQNGESNLQMAEERPTSLPPSDIDHLGEPHLGDDRAQLSGRRRDTVRGRAVTRRERLTRDHEGRRVRPEVLEEVCEAVEEHERLRTGVGCGHLLVPEAHDNEENRENAEAHELNWLPPPRVDE